MRRELRERERYVGREGKGARFGLRSHSLPHPLAVFPAHFSPAAVPTIRIPGTGYIANNSGAVILTSSSDRVRPSFFLLTYMQTHKRAYVCD